MRPTALISRIKTSGNVPFVLIIVSFIGIFYSTFLTTFSLIGICLYALLFSGETSLKSYFINLRFSPLLLLFILILLSGLNSENTSSWLTALRVKIPFLILPLAFFMIPKAVLPNPRRLMYILIILTSIVGFPVLIYSLTHHKEMLDLISKGQAIPTPIEHVKYSMFNAFATNVALFLLMKDWKIIGLFQRVILGGSVLFLVCLLHVLAVRTGLVLFYAGVVFTIICLALVYGHKKTILISLPLLLVIAFASYFFVPSIKEKVGYMRYDWMQFENKGGKDYSDSERIMTAVAGLEVWKTSMVYGVGYGDVKEVVIEKCHELYQFELNKLPHSQFLLTLVGAGIIGLILFAIGFYVPFIKAIKWSESGILLSLLYLNYTLSFLVENSLERSMSVSYFLIIALVLIKELTADETPLEA